jgi:hypothetical protein
MIALRSPGRLATAVGLAVAAVGATVMAVSVAQAAPEPGRCIDNVNVRERPEANARVIGLCRTGTRVTVEERRAGFVKLKEYNGWSVERYVETGTPRGRSADPSASTSGRSRPSGSATTSPTRGAAAERSTAPSGSAAPSSSARTSAAAQPDDVEVEEEPAARPSQPAPRGGLGGLFG